MAGTLPRKGLISTAPEVARCRVLQRLGFPSVGHHRRFVTAMAVDAVGSGVFMPLSMLYFLAVTPLALVQVGAAISVAALVALPAGPVIGTVVDRLGARRVLLAGNVLQAVGFAAYLVVDSFLGVLIWSIVVTVGRTAFWGAYGDIVAEIAPPGERERWFGFLGALRNVGFAVGGLVASVVRHARQPTRRSRRSWPSTRRRTCWRSGCCWPFLRAPAPGRARCRATGAPCCATGPTACWCVAQFGYSLPMMMLNFALPVYAVTVLGAARLGHRGGVHRQLLDGRLRSGTGGQRADRAGALPGAAARPRRSSPRRTWCSGRRARCRVVVATAVVLVGGVVYTLAELIGGPVLAALAAEAAPDAPAGSLPVADPARLEPQRRGRRRCCSRGCWTGARPAVGGDAGHSRWSAGCWQTGSAGCCRTPQRRSRTGPRPVRRRRRRGERAGHGRSCPARVGTTDCERSKRGVAHARRSADRWRGLPRPERRDPGGGPQGRQAARLRVRRLPRRLGGPARGRDHGAGRRAVPRHPAARRHHPRLLAHQPVQDRGRRRADQGEPRRRRRRRAGRDRRRGHPRRRHQARRPRRQRGRRTQDDRQRPLRHRLHLRLRHRGQHRHRGDRPAAHHGRVPPPGARRRGDGPARRLDRAALRHRRRREHRADPRAALRHRRGLRGWSRRRFETQYAPIIVVSEGAVPARGRAT